MLSTPHAHPPENYQAFFSKKKKKKKNSGYLLKM